MKSLKDDFEKAFNSKDEELSRTKEGDDIFIT